MTLAFGEAEMNMLSYSLKFMTTLYFALLFLNTIMKLTKQKNIIVVETFVSYPLTFVFI